MLLYYVFFFKQKTAYEMRISDWSSDVCSSDLRDQGYAGAVRRARSRRSRGGHRAANGGRQEMGRFRDGGGAVSDDDDLDPGFAERFQRADTREPCQLYLVPPLDVYGGFAEPLTPALDAGPVAAVPSRVHPDAQLARAPLAETPPTHDPR